MKVKDLIEELNKHNIECEISFYSFKDGKSVQIPKKIKFDVIKKQYGFDKIQVWFEELMGDRN